ncbi:SDR family NAD(P)-dependent oxidoreductase, partial [Streptomyces specialis]|uniref:SDR family NAD(P)-dependent oxidoreductase n=1 Tax=Streptomyces specialis TaxID=498367 RepID=UPI000A8B6F5C
PYRPDLRDPGLRPDPVWVPTRTPAAPGPRDLLVRVRAAALNYRDVMLATGLLPPDAEVPQPGGPAIGLECAGDVIATGADVTGFRPGDRVYALAPGAMASHVLVRAETAGRVPDGMTYAEAATLPVVFLTVHHALERLARLAPGETLLVHGGAGGVGLAALQYARYRGADVIATAGTSVKRDLLRALGVTHVLDSRRLGFAEHVLPATGGQGVDVVLNTLSGEAVTRSLEALRPCGRFIELGKRDVYANAPLPLRPLRATVAFHVLDINQLPFHAPQEAAASRDEVVRRIAAGISRPLPHQAYPADRIADALRALQHSRHLGKVIVTCDEPPALRRPVPTPRLDPRGTYLVTGGLGGFGAATARHLAARGARCLDLVSRRGADIEGAAELIEELAALGTRARAHAADVTDPDALRRIIDRADAEDRPLRGVVHSVLCLDDAPLAELTPERFAAVLAPKMRGALVLDALTRDRDLDLFVMYSSVSALIGNQLQAPYAAGNLVQEALVRARRAAGAPGLAVGWGGIGETGYLFRAGMTETFERLGAGAVPPDLACAALDRLLGQDTDVATVGRFDWHRMARALSTLSAARFTALTDGGPGEDTAGRSEEFTRRYAAAADDDEARAVVADTLLHLAARVLQTTPERLDGARNLDDLGLDSLMMAELATVMRRAFGCELPVMELVGVSSLSGLAERVHRILRRRPGSGS